MTVYTSVTASDCCYDIYNWLIDLYLLDLCKSQLRGVVSIFSEISPCPVRDKLVTDN